MNDHDKAGELVERLAKADHSRTLYARALEKMRIMLVNVHDNLQDEGDRVYLGSTNDADELKALEAEMLDDLNWLECPWMHGRDLYAEIRVLRAGKAELIGALQNTLLAAMSSDATKPQIAEMIHAALAKATGEQP